jgi:uncharacterized protein DUF4019
MSRATSMSRRAFGGALGALALAPFALAQDPRASMAQRAARDWLALADAIDPATSWQKAGARFRDAMSADRWKEALRREREPRGAADRRTVTSTQFVGSIAGYGEGDFAIITFRTSFAHRGEGAETITLQREADDVWRVVGYSLR